MATIGERMSSDLHTVPRETPLGACLKIMQKNGFRHLPVCEPSGRLLGMVSEYEVLDAIRADQKFGWAIERLQSTKLTVTPDTEVGYAIAKMLDARKDWVLAIDPVGRPIGMFTEKDALAYALEVMDPWPTVGEVMTAGELFVVPTHTPAQVALNHMFENQIRHLLVLEDETTMRGVISHRDLVGQHGAVEKYMKDPIFVAHAGASLKDPIEVMVREGVGSIPVLGEGRDPIGIVTRVDVMKALVAQIGDD